MSPIHLASPILELTAEYRVLDKLGLALIGGGGKMTQKSVFFPDETYTVIEAGAQARYYVLGDFVHGMELGAELLYVYVDRDDDSNVAATGAGVALGPFIGYKIATNIGFTFDTQLGFQYLTAQAEATDGTNSSTGKDSQFLPLVNINVGWSF